VRFTPNILNKRHDDAERRWPNHIFGGRVRTSTVVLIVALVLAAWVYNTYRPQPGSHNGPPPTQVVPPGFVPDPNYTWVPRTRVDQPQETTVPKTPTTTETTTPSPTTPPPFTLPPPPCLLPPPFCPPSTTPATPSPGPGPTPPAS
jgi:hypothetical protein